MADALGWRGKIGVAIPSTNTILQPDFEAMRPDGVTNHTGRIMTPNMAIGSDEDFATLMGMIDVEIYAAVDRLLTAAPDRIVVGISSFMIHDIRSTLWTSDWVTSSPESQQKWYQLRSWNSTSVNVGWRGTRA